MAEKQPYDHLRILCKPDVVDGKVTNVKEIIRASDRFFEEADDNKAHDDRNWPTWYSSVTGKLWREQLIRKLPLQKGSKIQKQTYYIAANYSGHLIRQLVAWLTPRQPNYDIQVSGLQGYDMPLSMTIPPYGVTDEGQFNEWLAQRSDRMETIERSSWIEGEYEIELERSIYDMATFGVGFIRSYIDDLTYKPGIKSVPAWNILVDKTASSNKDAWGLIECNVVPVAEIAKYGPDKVAKVRADVDKRKSYTMEDAEDLVRGANSTNYARGGTEPSKAAGDAPLKRGESGLPMFSDEVLLKDFWVKDVSRKFWHHYTIAGGVLLDYTREDYLPYIDFRWIETEHYWGMGAAGILYPIEAAIEMILSLMLNSVRLTMFPSLVYALDTFSGRKDIIAIPGQSLVTSPGRSPEPRWLQPPNVPPYVDAYLQFLVAYGAKLVGLEGLLAAQAQGRGTPIGVIQQLSENSTVTIRATANRINSYLSCLLRTQCRQIAEANSAFFTSYAIPPSLDPSGTRLLQLSPGYFELEAPGANGVPEARPLDFAVFVDSATVMSRAAQKEDMMWLVGNGMADDEYAHEVLGTPGKYRLMKRMASKQPAAAQAAKQLSAAASQDHGQPGPNPITSARQSTEAVFD